MKIQGTLISLTLAGSLAAQDAPSTASSANHFVASSEFGAGGRTISTTHELHASLGNGMIASRAFSGTHVLTGGFNASLDVATTGKPWLSAVEPRYTAMRSGVDVTIVGTEQNLGTAVTIGGAPPTCSAGRT